MSLEHALQFFRAGAYPKAIALLQKIVAAEPAQLAPRLNLAKACLDWMQIQAKTPLTEIEFAKLGEQPLHFLNMAESHLQALAKTHAASPHVQNLLAMVHLIHARYDDALRCLKKAQAKDPLNPELLYNIGYALMELERYADASAQFRRLTALHPKHATGWHMLGEALRHTGKPDEALQAYREAHALEPDWFQHYGALASVLRDLGRFDEALAMYAEGLVKHPGNLDLNFSLATSALASGHWATGWRYYASRSAEAHHLPFPENHVIPLTRGQPVRIHYDQGLGDELFFLRFVPALVARGMTVHYVTSPKLFPLLDGQSCIASLEVAGAGECQPHDLLVGDLPYLVGMRSTADIPPSLVLRPDEVRRHGLSEQLAAFGPPPYLGVTWMGGTPRRPGSKGVWRSLHKDIPPGLLGKLARDWPGSVVVLQRLPGPADVASFSKALGRPWLDWSQLNDDLRDALAGLSLLDEYVGVSNTNMHLLAGIGKTARVLVPHPADWRWMAEGDESPWFPGFRIYRQSIGGTWEDALARLKQDLSDQYKKEAQQ